MLSEDEEVEALEAIYDIKKLLREAILVLTVIAIELGYPIIKHFW